QQCRPDTAEKESLACNTGESERESFQLANACLITTSLTRMPAHFAFKDMQTLACLLRGGKGRLRSTTLRWWYTEGANPDTWGRGRTRTSRCSTQRGGYWRAPVGSLRRPGRSFLPRPRSGWCARVGRMDWGTWCTPAIAP